MTSRERWTIYPLLLLAIGIALRDQFPSSATRFAGRLEAVQIVCDELAVREPVQGAVRFDNLLVNRIYTLDRNGNRILVLDSATANVPFLLKGAREISAVNEGAPGGAALESAEQDRASEQSEAKGKK